MKQVGPPPSYPGLPIPGVNAPIPQEILSTTMADQWGSLPLNQVCSSLPADWLVRIADVWLY